MAASMPFADKLTRETDKTNSDSGVVKKTTTKVPSLVSLASVPHWRDLGIIQNVNKIFTLILIIGGLFAAVHFPLVDLQLLHYDFRVFEKRPGGRATESWYHVESGIDQDKHVFETNYLHPWDIVVQKAFVPLSFDAICQRIRYGQG